VRAAAAVEPLLTDIFPRPAEKASKMTHLEVVNHIGSF
jgi:hypothetical protein